jgi:hypothetical protein
MDVLAHDLSKYFVAQAKIYIEKPEGSGTEIGWHFLGEALAYEPSNPAAIDAQTAASAAHQMHSKVSLKVRFRDRTSSRNSSGFIDTLEDTIVAALEESPMVKAVRASEQSSGTTSVEPDFQLDGEILEHEITPTPTSIPKESHYRAGTEPYTNDKWTQAKHAFDAANRDIETDRTELQAAETKGKKKEIQEWKDKLAEHQKKATDAQAALDSTQQNLTRDVIRSYNYTQQTIDVKNTIKLQFRIGEKLGDEKGNAEVVEKEENKQFILIEDVKPEDTDNIKNAGTSPITRELQTALENLVRDKLVEKVKERVSKLPEGIYSQAKMKEQEENINGAAESYLRFLSVTTEDGSAERKHAQEFLEKNFNMDIDDEAKR